MHKILLALALFLALPASAQDDGVRVKPTSMTTQVDAGQVVKGSWNDTRVDDAIIQRTSVWITQELQIGPRLDVRAGVGGLFWYAVPGPQPTYSNVGPFVASTKFGPGITRADMSYRFMGDEAAPVLTLQAGFFPYKYNNDARNLGEYLLRSGTYPGTLTSGGWNILSEAAYMMQGIRLNLNLLDGRLRQDFMLPMERDLPPMGDISPTYVMSFAPIKGIEVGGGASWNHLISFKPSQVSPKIIYDPTNSTNSTTYGNGNAYIIENANYNPALPTTDLYGSNPRYVYDTTGNFYTFRGVKLMARASVDPKAFVPMSMLGPEDLKVFGEVALLGVKNYPFYYEKRTERMPVMFGINLPTFKWIDLVSFQMEYYNSPFPNSTRNSYRYGMPTHSFVNAAGNDESDPNLHDRDNKEIARDNWKWSLYAKKEIVSGLRLYTQVANDHLRVPQWDVTHSETPLTTVQGRDWYYLVRLELGI